MAEPAVAADEEVEGQEAVVVRIRYDKIRRDPNNPRKRFNQTALKGLAASIAEEGQREPIKVVIQADGTYRLKAGERRWRACGMLGKKTMRAIVENPKDAPSEHLDALVDNACREDMTPIEFARALAEAKEHPKFRGLGYAELHQRLGALCGKSAIWAQQHLAYLDLHPQVQEMLDVEDETKRLSSAVATSIHALPQHLQVKVAMEIMKRGLKIGEARIHIRNTVMRVNGKILGRKPSDDYRILEAFVRRLNRDAESMLLMSAERFDKMFEHRTEVERGELLRILEETSYKMIELRNGIANVRVASRVS